MSANEKTQRLVDQEKLAEAAGVRVRFVVKWRRQKKAGAFMAGRIGLRFDEARECAAQFTDRKLDLKKLALDDPKGLSVVVSVVPSNVNVLLCRRLDTDELVTVTVRDNTAFRAGDEFTADLSSSGALTRTGEWPERNW